MAELLEVGMLLFQPAGEDGPRPHVWTVERVGKRSARAVCHTGTCVITATLTVNTVPDGWRRINHAALVAHLREQLPPPAPVSQEVER